MATTIEELQSLHVVAPTGQWAGPIPVPDIDTEPFWTGLREERLMILRCTACGFWIHTPVAGCPRCLSADVAPRQASGRGEVYSFSVVNREFAPGIKPPYVVALAELVEQESLRLVTNLINVRVGDIRIGMPIRVVFHDIGEASLAFFEPDGERG